MENNWQAVVTVGLLLFALVLGLMGVAMRRSTPEAELDSDLQPDPDIREVEQDR